MGNHNKKSANKRSVHPHDQRDEQSREGEPRACDDEDLGLDASVRENPQDQSAQSVVCIPISDGKMEVPNLIRAVLVADEEQPPANVCPERATDRVPFLSRASPLPLWSAIALLVLLFTAALIAAVLGVLLALQNDDYEPTSLAPTTQAPTETVLERAIRRIPGVWEGEVDSQWGSWQVQVIFTTTGTVTSNCYCLFDACEPCTSFYYGSDEDVRVDRHYELNDVRADGAVKGWIDVGWPGGHLDGESTTRGSLDSLYFSGTGDQLTFEFLPTWQDGGLGRIFTFTLERVID